MYLGEYIEIKTEGCLIIFKYLNNGIIKDSRIIDVLNFTEAQKDKIRTLLKHWENVPLVTTYEDLKYIRKLGLKI